MAPARNQPDWRSRLLRILGGLSLTGYVLWNAWWLLQARIPPSILLTVTGLPAPTTGGTRAIRALAVGDLGGMLRHNAFALPLTLLFLISIIRPWLSQPQRLPPSLARAWIVLLAAAWVVKLTQVAMQ